MPKKEDGHNNGSIGNQSGLNTKTITSVNVWTAGSMQAVEINFSGGPTLIKFKQGQCEWGGDGNWGSGTRVF